MTLIKLPGLIDPHVHLRDPGQTEKEDFYTGTCAALAGGYTTIIDMPNNKIPITTLSRLEEKEKIAKEKIICDVGFHFGSVGNNLLEFEKVKHKVIGLKLYLNETTGNFLINSETSDRIYASWSQSMLLHSSRLSAHPILVHAEGDIIEKVLKVVEKTGVFTHFCHISLESDLKHIIQAKNENLPVTCGVTPHHLLLTENDIQTLGPFGTMKPPLASKKDQEFLWNNLHYIDIIESDHAPHTVEEKVGKVSPLHQGFVGQAKVSKVPKENSMAEETNFRVSRMISKDFKKVHDTNNGSIMDLPNEPVTRKFPFPTPPKNYQIPYGVPGLETTLPLLLTAVSEKKLTIDDVIQMCSTNPAKIFGIPQDNSTYAEVDPNAEHEIKNENLFTKCKWSPFDEWKVTGKVARVFIRGTKVFEDGKILVDRGFGKIIYP